MGHTNTKKKSINIKNYLIYYVKLSSIAYCLGLCFDIGPTVHDKFSLNTGYI